MAAYLIWWALELVVNATKYDPLASKSANLKKTKLWQERRTILSAIDIYRGDHHCTICLHMSLRLENLPHAVSSSRPLPYRTALPPSDLCSCFDGFELCCPIQHASVMRDSTNSLHSPLMGLERVRLDASASRVNELQGSETVPRELQT
ncbi:Lysosomal-Trafficking Regulator [Manis pentadactyla]|nr:Lysosomal-Trafficking Regulator [Manis pentadactyla]